MDNSITRNGESHYRARATAVNLPYRIVTAFVLLVCIVASAFIFLFSIEAIRLEDLVDLVEISVGGAILEIDWSVFSWLERSAIVVGSLVGGLVILVVLFRMMTPHRRSSALHLLEADDSGFVVVDSRGISTIAAQAALTAPGVVDVETTIHGTGFSPVRVKVGIGIYPRTNLLATGKEVRSAVKDAVERYAGIEVRDVAVKAHIVEADSFGRMLG